MEQKVSVVIPVYNVENVLRRCINSVINQSYRNIEVILIDDGSTDASGIICDEYALMDKRIKVIHIPNGGVSNARNQGIAMANGDFILFVDSDDEILPRYVESFFNNGIDKNKCLLMQGCFCERNGIITKYEYSDKKYTSKEFGKCISEEELFMHGSPYGKLFSNNLIKDNSIRFSTELKNYEDLMFFLDYINCIESIRLMSNLGYIYHIQGTGLHLSYSSIENEEYLLNSYLEKTKKYTTSSPEDRISSYSLVLLFRIMKSLYFDVKVHNKKRILMHLCEKYKHLFLYSNRYLGKKLSFVLLLLKGSHYNIANFIMSSYINHSRH